MSFQLTFQLQFDDYSNWLTYWLTCSDQPKHSSDGFNICFPCTCTKCRSTGARWQAAVAQNWILGSLSALSLAACGSVGTCTEFGMLLFRRFARQAAHAQADIPTVHSCVVCRKGSWKNNRQSSGLERNKMQSQNPVSIQTLQSPRKAGSLI